MNNIEECNRSKMLFKKVELDDENIKINNFKKKTKTLTLHYDFKTFSPLKTVKGQSSCKKI
jgi:hypothetical protein